MRIDFSIGKILVIGDCMLDRYCFGTVGRISPEAPVPVVKVSRNDATLGGAGNVANNLAHLEAAVCVIGPIGNDTDGSMVRRLCKQNRIRFSPLVSHHPTITKTRVIGERQQIVRIDFEEEFRFDPPSFKRTRTLIAEKLPWAGVIVLSDYGKGFCSKELCSWVIHEARKRKLPVIVDPKGHNWEKYRGAAIVTPNVKELSDIAGINVDNTDAAVASNGKAIRQAFNLHSLLVTRSEKGMSLITKSNVIHYPTDAREVFDVSGAGDTVVATLAAALASGYILDDAAKLANRAAGIVVGKMGTAPIELTELRAAFDHDHNPKLLDNVEIVERTALLKQQGKRIVFTNGCFDILHRGHLHLLQKAKRLGDILIVALNSDRSDRTLKGPGYPINTETDRAHLMAAIDAVDFVTVFDEETPLALIKKLRPDVIVKGGNYRETEVLGREYAGKAVIIPQLKGYNTKEIARKIAGG